MGTAGFACLPDLLVRSRLGALGADRSRYAVAAKEHGSSSPINKPLLGAASGFIFCWALRAPRPARPARPARPVQDLTGARNTRGRANGLAAQMADRASEPGSGDGQRRRCGSGGDRSRPGTGQGECPLEAPCCSPVCSPRRGFYSPVCPAVLAQVRVPLARSRSRQHERPGQPHSHARRLPGAAPGELDLHVGGPSDGQGEPGERHRGATFAAGMHVTGHPAGPSRITPRTSSSEIPGSNSVIHHVAPASA